ncbi:tyrosine phosphatase, partial [Oryctes borbonicus]
ASLPFEVNACYHLVDQDLEGALKALEGEEQVDPREMAIVKFTPSAENPNAQYADEVYYPPVPDEKAAIRDIILPQDAIDIFDMEDPYADYSVQKRTWIPQMRRRSVPLATSINLPSRFRMMEAKRDKLEFLRANHLPNRLPFQENRRPLPKDIDTSTPEVTPDDLEEFYPMVNYIYRLKATTQDFRDLPMNDKYQKLKSLLDDFSTIERPEDIDINDLLTRQISNEDEEEDNLAEGASLPERFMMTYNTPDNFRAGWESRDLLDDDIPESRVYIDETDEDYPEEYGSGAHTESDEIFRELKQLRKHERGEEEERQTSGYSNDDEIFRELKQMRKNEDTNFTGIPKKFANTGKIVDTSGLYTEGGVVYAPKSKVSDDLNTEDSLKENLDELLDEYRLGFQRPERLDVKKPGPMFDSQRTTNMPTSEAQDVILPSMMKKEPRGAHPNPSHEVYDVDTDYVFVGFRNSVQMWRQGDEIIQNISKLLNLEPGTLDSGRVDRNEVTFKVHPNKHNLNASEVARRIVMIRDDLKKSTGVEITAVGVGDKVKTVLVSHFDSKNEFYITPFAIFGIVGALIIASLLLVIIRRHVVSKEKLHSLTKPDTEASKDYQDLCRARMAIKGQTPGETIHGRVTSLSKESEQSPSSRSSTSSWSEEPALHNMDISTGHMVLSYMEDHLRNKDRLDQEWVALCAYIAEPCETSIALKKENVNKNRCKTVLPYDHSRVVLNELSNATGSDYINASSITDHDPRNPAYIATQGPLPHTAPDFWQLIWEQGAVVIVMLSRLTEGDVAMCHRYWPEEGSEVYHIYEVHLVSEHIWCDDYLVRSFYLKNIRTGETRTVTQFHFLSWPEASVPSSTKALLEFRRKVNKSYRGRSCPIVVHCSDGAGRTGTYCLIDMVLSRMAKGAKEIDIAATLEHLRDQRPRMVATKQQFEFVLTAVAEEVHAILKALPPQPAPIPQEKEKETK